jgi:hypothetical protein
VRIRCERGANLIDQRARKDGGAHDGWLRARWEAKRLGKG